MKLPAMDAVVGGIVAKELATRGRQQKFAETGHDELRSQRMQRSGRVPFFQRQVDHMMQGFYGSPRHGGNKNEASWKMLGIAPNMGHGPHA